MPIIFALWGAGIFLRYLADFGTATALTAGMIVTFREDLFALSFILAAGAASLFAASKLRLVSRFNSAGRMSARAKHLLFAGLALVPFLFWPAIQLLQGTAAADVAPGLGAALATILIAAAALSCGLRLGRLLKYAPTSLLEQAVAGAALGFGALMFAGFAMGVAHLYYRPVAYLVIALALWSGRKDLVNFLASCRMYVRVHTRSKRRSTAVLAAGIIFLVLATMLSAGVSMQYPVGYDSAISYLTYPQEYIREHSMVAFPFWIYWGFPQNAEMLFTLGWLLSDFRVAAGIIFLFTLLIGGTILLLLRGRKSVTKAIALVIFYTIPVIAFQNFVEQKAEVIFAFYVMLSYVFALRHMRDRQRASLILCGIFSGIAAGLKYFFFPWYAIPILLLFLWMAYRDRSRIEALVVWGLIAMALFAPWAVRNMVVSGKPLDPINLPLVHLERQTFFSQFGTEGTDYVVTEMRNEAYLLWDDHERKDLLYFARAPFSLTFMGNKKYLSDGLRLGPLLLMFLPLVLAVLARKKLRFPTSELGFAAFALPILVAGWIYLGHLATWYAIPMYALFAVIAGWAVEECSGKRMRFVAILALCAWTALFISDQYYRRFTYAALYNPNSEKQASLWQMSEWINTELPPEAKVWGIGEPRGLYIDRSFERYIPDNYHLAFSWILQERGPEGALKFLADNNIEYLLIHGGYGSPETPNVVSWAYLPNGSQRYAELIWRNNLELMEFKDGYLELVRADGSYFLYKVKTQAEAP